MKPWQLAFVALLGAVFCAPAAWGNGEEAEVQQMFQECVASGGRAASNYNDWVAQDGCICPGETTGSGSRTCSGAAAAPPSDPGNLIQQSSSALVKGAVNSDAQEVGVGVVGLGAAILINGLTPDPAAEAEREREEAAQQAAAEAENQQRAAEAARKADETKARLLGESGGASGDLHMMGVTGDPSLAPMGGNAGATIPAQQAAAPMRSDAYIKGLHDASECFSQNAGTFCATLPGDRLQACVGDYHGGYAAGSKQQKMRLDEAARQGQLDHNSGKPNSGFNDPRASGGCRVDWLESYNSGYSQNR
ncbi:MAG TPA: hypothetical protein VF651_07370 [Gammaproteobacteria bacterium]